MSKGCWKGISDREFLFLECRNGYAEVTARSTPDPVVQHNQAIPSVGFSVCPGIEADRTALDTRRASPNFQPLKRAIHGYKILLLH